MAQVALEHDRVGLEHQVNSRDPDRRQEGAAGQQRGCCRALRWHQVAVVNNENRRRQLLVSVPLDLDDTCPQRRALVALATATGPSMQGDLRSRAPPVYHEVCV